nr:unnamed protein product [Callosobruchus chinensis]
MNSTDEDEFKPAKLNVYYAACEILVAIFAVVGNALVIFVFRKERRLRRRTNYYIVSLATADLLVGLLESLRHFVIRRTTYKSSRVSFHCVATSGFVYDFDILFSGSVCG